MSETLVISSRGQITLPAALRRRLGIKGGDVIILEERGTEVVFKPGVVLEYWSTRNTATMTLMPGIGMISYPKKSEPRFWSVCSTLSNEAVSGRQRPVHGGS